ncbi:hypothetical protein [Phenylobacterium sp.]|uniref:hypothetical protein n=1 Tax=Phenylobacterium sp. TaxID=1871053 RepID=UPI0011F7AEEA|nr:hypothetical protein [Phenylobacterium sp.]THD64984.1 MAG: hypothetical protein E8A49_00255 [Phenylobacterium sp.]
MAAMTKMALKVGVALACAASLVGCQRADTVVKCPPAKAPPKVVALPAITGANDYPVRVQSECTGANKLMDVVHIIVWNVDDPQLESSVLLHYKSDPLGNQHSGRTAQPNPTAVPNSITRIDFDAGAYLANPGDVVLIELELQDAAGYVFAPGKDTAVFTSDAANGQMFCVKKPMVVGKNANLVRFYARYIAPVNGKPVFGAYNFHIVTPTGKERLISVDPEVKNNG